VQQAENRPALDKEWAYWCDCAGRWPASLPRHIAEGANDEASAGSVTLWLSAEETRALLQDAPTAYHTQINDLLLAALLQALAGWTGCPNLLLNLEGHGREDLFEDIDLSRTVGWFTTTYPVWLSLPETSAAVTPGSLIQAVKEQLRRIPNRGFGYGLLRYLDGDRRIGREWPEQPQPEVSFNYLGQFKQPADSSSLFEWVAQPSGPLRSPRARRSHLLEINSMVVAGRLQVEWNYSRNCHHAATIQQVAGQYLAVLRELIDHCLSLEQPGYTPSDFPEMELDQEDLDNILAEIEFD
jgi:non-ribosomal peptide synthase protein (TIGR01720 family)